MNKLMIIGNLTADPQTRMVQTRDGEITVCFFTVAVNERGRNGQNDPQFFRVNAWRGLGENCAKFLAKGRKALVIGPASASSYTTSSGETRVQIEITANEVEFLSPKDSSVDVQGAQSVQRAIQQAPQQTEMGGFTPVEEDELPF